MKIYINNFNLDLLNDISEIFKEFLINSETYIKLYTNEGIYHIEDKKIYLLDPCDIEIKIFNNYYNNFTLILDPSFFHKRDYPSIHGETHLSFHIVKKYYRFNKSSNISMIIEYLLNNNKLTPHDIYFESNKDIDMNNLFVKNEIIEFLSLLN